MKDKSICLNDQADFLKQYNFSSEEFNKTGLDWKLLEQIYIKHIQMRDELQSTADYISDRLRQVSAVHSLKVRIKDPEHLVEKIIRKKIERPETSFDLINYKEQITDLIGIRALHLFKDDWRMIHEFIIKTWDPLETPIANVRNGDSENLINDFKKANFAIKEHPFGYRSIHYLIKSQPAKDTHFAELQVRTIFEEAWSEIDHKIRYPRQSDDPYLAQFLTIFNRLAGSADEMGTFIKALSGYIREQSDKLRTREQQFIQKEEELKKVVSQLKIDAKDKEALQKQIDELQKSSHRYDPIVIGASSALSNVNALSLAAYSGYNALNLGIGSKSEENIMLTSSIDKVCIKCGKPFTHNALALIGESNICPACRHSKIP